MALDVLRLLGNIESVEEAFWNLLVKQSEKYYVVCCFYIQATQRRDCQQEHAKGF